MNNYTTLSTSILQYAATTTRAGVGIWDLQAGKLKKILAYSMHSAHVTNAVLNKAGDKAISSENGSLLCNIISFYVTLAIPLANGAHILIFTLVIQNKIEHKTFFFINLKSLDFLTSFSPFICKFVTLVYYTAYFIIIYSMFSYSLIWIR